MNKYELALVVNAKVEDDVRTATVEKAKEYIRQGNRKLYEIGYEIGFDDTAYFSKLFKKYEGCSPREFESRMKKE